MKFRRPVISMVAVLVLAGCSGGGGEDAADDGESSPTSTGAPATTTSSVTSTAAEPEPAEYEFAVVREDPDSGNTDIYLIDADGGETRLTDDDAYDEFPAFSPDGTHITFDSNRTGDWEVYVVGVDGTGLERLTDAEGEDGYTSWSPDGQSIVLDSERDGDYEIYTLDIETGELATLTDNDAWDGEPDWSPDGRSIVFHSDRDGDGVFDLYTMNTDGSSVTRIVENGFGPDWSPDGRSVVFARENEDASDRDLWVVDVESGAEKLVLGGDAWQGDPAWSADGSRIYFNADPSGFFTVYSVNTDGSDLQPLVDGDETVFAVAVRP